jgi:diguanylate cyclase (GGDEF)-like protein
LSIVHRYCCLLLSLLCFGGAPAWALDPQKNFHDYVRDTWGVLNGLPQSTVLAIAQDAEGYLWVGMQSGLGRFDGVRFLSYTPNSTPELPGETVQALHQDRSGRLWIGTYKGLASYKDGHFERWEAPDGLHLNVRDLAELADGDMVVATDRGVFHPQNGKLVADPRFAGPVASLAVTPDFLWVGYKGGVYRATARDIVSLELPPDAEHAEVTRLLAAGGRIWAGSDDGLFELQHGHWIRSMVAPQVARSPIGVLFQDHDRNLWVGAHSGLARIHGGQLMEWLPRDAKVTVPDYRSAFEDHEGSLWLGSRGDGITRLWNGWVKRISVDQGLNEAIVWSVAKDPDSGRLWIGTDNGLSVLEHGQIREILAGSALPHPNAYTLLAEPGRLWIGTRRGVTLLENGQLRLIPALDQLEGLQVSGILRARDGALWFATDGGVFRLNGNSLDAVPGPGQDQGQGQEIVRARGLLQTHDGRIVVSTQQGLMHIEQGRLAPFTPSEQLPTAIDVMSLYEFDDGTLLIGTLSERLLFLHRGRWIEFTAAQGAPPGAAFFVTEDHDGYLWLGGLRGLFRIEREALMALLEGRGGHAPAEQLLNARNERFGGQAGQCCNGAGNAKGALDGARLWLPTRDGLVAVQTDHIEHNPQPPQVHIERMLLADRELEAPRDGRELELQLGVRDMSLEFTALSFQNPASVRLLYRLDGYDTRWYEVDDYKKRATRYTNLPPGHYRFEVRASNNAEVWNPQVAELRFFVPPHFHETWWFKLLLALAAMLAVLLINSLRMRVELRRRRQLEDMVKARTDELQRANQRLQEASTTDSLTGLRNRRFLIDQLPGDLAFYLRKADRDGDTPQSIAFALLDIDHFKNINDTLGHAAGDRVLQQLAELLVVTLRQADYIVRWGGEEFLLVLRPMPADEIPAVIERIRASVATHPFDTATQQILRLSCSIGFVEMPLRSRLSAASLETGWQTLLELADHALYSVKRDGRNGWAGFRPRRSDSVERLFAGEPMAPASPGTDEHFELLRSPRREA